jgi:hypothetical protein
MDGARGDGEGVTARTLDVFTFRDSSSSLSSCSTLRFLRASTPIGLALALP